MQNSKINPGFRLLLVLISVFFTLPSYAAIQSEVFQARIFKSSRDETLPYRLFIPPGYDRSKRYPLMLWLHGGAGRGKDNLKQITDGNTAGSHVWVIPENQSKYPCFVVAPQCPEGQQWASYDTARPTRQLELVLSLLESLKKQFSIDSERLYVSGQSMGGFGTWSLITQYPKRFAAAVPVCGGGNESKASMLVNVALWVFHGEKDEAVSVDRSRKMVAAIRRLGGEPKYTEYKGKGHVIWDEVFGEAELLRWVFGQRRNAKPHSNSYMKVRPCSRLEPSMN